jgi:predicted metal-dependent enzyme (double-stranded beta helix superfamily)
MNYPITNQLQHLISDIKNQAYMDNSIVADMVQSHQLQTKDVAPYMLFNHSNHESYGRTLIFDNGNFKILLMSWKAGDFTAIHNHGFTEWGCVYTFGEATHRLYEVVQNELKLIQKDNFPAGAIASVCGDLTHMMGNAGSEDFVTLHIYGSNTRKSNVSANAKVYVPEVQKVVTTMGSAFLNMSKELVLSETPLKKMDSEIMLDYYTLVKPYYERINNTSVLNAMEKIY